MKISNYIRFSNGKKRPKEIGTIPVYGGNGILGYTNKSNTNKNNIIIGRVGAYCGCVYKSDNECWVSDNAILGKVKEGTDYNFLYYLLKSIDLHRLHIGAAHPLMTQEILNDVEVNLPSYSNQVKIGKFLENIDKKVELNNRINDNLFEISCLHYKEWYGKLDSNQEATYLNLKELGNIVMGQSPKGESYNFEKEGVPLINGAADYENGFLMAQKYTSMPTKICQKNDLIFCIRATIGLLVISDNEYCLGRGVAGITNIDEEYKEYAFHIIYNSIEEFKKMATGSVIVGISRNDIEKIKVKIPTREQIQEFHKIQSPIFNKIENIRKENQTLVKLRDTLLAKLMNGEIDIDKIEI